MMICSVLVGGSCTTFDESLESSAKNLRYKTDNQIEECLCIDPLHVCGNAANLEDKTKEIFASITKSYCLAAFPRTCKGSIKV